MTAAHVSLLLIDPQNDFCDIPDALRLPCAPALPVSGAHNDMLRLAAFIERVGRGLTDVHVTLDSHNPFDIAHPAWWLTESGENPAPFTVLTSDDLSSGRYRAAVPELQAYSERYVSQLAAGGRYPLIVWPEHCLVGGWGQGVHAAVKGALDTWSRRQLRAVDYVTKGLNPKTEHYSALRAEVPDGEDEDTLLNSRLMRALSQADLVLVAGEALSHCVANTVRDIVSADGNIARKLVLLADCSSSVSGFEPLGQAFVSEMAAEGVRVTTSVEFQL